MKRRAGFPQIVGRRGCVTVKLPRAAVDLSFFMLRFSSASVLFYIAIHGWTVFTSDFFFQIVEIVNRNFTFFYT